METCTFSDDSCLIFSLQFLPHLSPTAPAALLNHCCVVLPGALKFSFCASVRHVHQQFIMGQRGIVHFLGSKGQRSRSQEMLKTAFLGHASENLEKYYMDLCQTYTGDAL